MRAKTNLMSFSAKIEYLTDTKQFIILKVIGICYEVWSVFASVYSRLEGWNFIFITNIFLSKKFII